MKPDISSSLFSCFSAFLRQAAGSRYIDRVIVSTDDDQVAEVAREGADGILPEGGKHLCDAAAAVGALFVIVVGTWMTEKRLAAYFVAGGSLSTPDLRAFLAQKLPDYMIPSTFTQLDAQPLTIDTRHTIKNCVIPVRFISDISTCTLTLQ